MTNQDLITALIEIEKETKKAIYEIDGTRGRKFWIPKSIFIIETKWDDGLIAIKIPKWFARKKGLIG